MSGGGGGGWGQEIGARGVLVLLRSRAGRPSPHLIRGEASEQACAREWVLTGPLAGGEWGETRG